MQEPQAANHTLSLNVDLIRTVAIILVILLHAAEEPISINNIVNLSVVVRWWSMNVYDSIARPCVPLFVMLTGALLLQPFKVEEPLTVFFKKRLKRIGLPLLFWGGAYFAWSYFADHTVYTLHSIGQALLTGPYYQFWYLYMLIGLYLLAPIFRVFVSHSNRKVIRYFIVLWFLGVAVVPVLQLVSGYTLNGTVFAIGGWIGYFVLGLYVLDVHLSSKVLYGILALGLAWTIAGTYLITYLVGGQLQYFFYSWFSINVILTSVALFMLLCKVPPNYVGRGSLSKNKLFHLPDNYREKLSASTTKLIHFISGCSLAIFLLHVIILESLQRGYLGVRISVMTINPIIDIPLITALTLLICLVLLYPISKISILKRLLGIID